MTHPETHNETIKNLQRRVTRSMTTRETSNPSFLSLFSISFSFYFFSKLTYVELTLTLVDLLILSFK